MPRPEHDRRLMLSFEGKDLPASVAATIANHDVPGITLFRPHNYETPEQLRALVESVQETSQTDLPMLIAIDQEGGQLHAFGAPATMWVGNMALGAADDVDLTREIGAALGRELRAVGINVNYAPNADLATNPANPATGARAFGDDAELVARHVVAMIEGLQSSGVAATVKHFPGKGDSAVDSHHAMPTITHDREHLEAVEFPPFRAAVAADVKLAMTGHFALPAVTGSEDLPCTLAYEANTTLLRDDMGFEGALITDALDMKALKQGAFQIVDIIAAINSGVDLLLLTADAEQEERATVGLELAVSRRLITPERLAEADQRVIALREWVGSHATPDLDVVGSPEHSEINARAAEQSIVLVRNEGNLVPLAAVEGTRMLVVEVQPAILTPADTSHYEQPHLAEAMRSQAPGHVESIVIPMDPGPEYVSAVASAAQQADVVVLGTSAASLFESQASLARQLISEHAKVIVVAQRTPWDLTVLPGAAAYLCAWSVNEPSARAAARAIMGTAPITGRLPVAVGDIPAGFGITLP
ncbi:MAG: glycoside hydrolase family 3 protein [Acidimicrobiia bacterium]